jgi:uncharacterized protein YndB with AHSA1/START domain
MVIDAPVERVWELLARFEHWPAWGISIRAVESSNDWVAPGVTGRVQTVAGFWLPFRICDVIPGSYWNWDVAGVGATGHHVTPATGQSARVEFTVPWVAAPYRAVFRRSLRSLKQLAEG